MAVASGRISTADGTNTNDTTICLIDEGHKHQQFYYINKHEYSLENRYMVLELHGTTSFLTGVKIKYRFFSEYTELK